MCVSTLHAAAGAQDAAAAVGPVTGGPDRAEMGDIVVTAQKRSENINKVPLSIQAFTGETLKAAGITDTSGLALVTPGLNAARSSANTPIYTLRGVGFNTPNLSSTSPVGVYVDEVAHAYPYMSNGPSFDIQRVEVLKGPQGTLYGRNTTGGLINFITSKPTDKLVGGISAEIGNYSTHNVEAYLSGPLTDTLGIRISGRWEKSDNGWQHSITRDDTLGRKNRLGGRVILDWKPTDRLSAELSASYWQDRSDTIAGQAVKLDADQPAFLSPGVASAIHTNWTGSTADWDPFDGSKPPFKVHSNFYSIAGRVNYKLSDSVTLVSLTGYNHVHRNDMNDVDGTPVEVFTLQSLGHIGSFSQELRLTGETGPLSYIVGGYYSVDKIVDDQIGWYGKSSVLQLLRFLSQNVIDPTNGLYSADQYANGFREFRNLTTQRSRSESIFGNVDWKLSDRFKLSGGLRYTDDQLKYGACSGDYNGNTLPIWNTSVDFLVNVQTGATPNFLVQPNGCMTYAANFTDLGAFQQPTLNQSNLAGRFSAQYTPGRDWLFYTTISRGFKSGAVPIVPANVATQLTPARQERVMAYEAGVKATLLDRALQVNVAGYYYDYKDKQLYSEVPDIVFTTLTRLLNIPKSRIYGGEADINWRATRDLTLRTGISYTKTEVTKFLGYNRNGQSTDFAGASFPYTPRLQVNGSVTYDRPISDTLGIDATALANYQSKTSGSLGNEDGFGVKAYTIVNASVGLYTLDKSWRISAWAKNLFNTYYWTATDVQTDTIFRIPGMPRTYGATLSWSF